MTPEPSSDVLSLTGFIEILKYHMTVSGCERKEASALDRDSQGRLPGGLRPAGWATGLAGSTALHTLTTADHPPLETQTDLILRSSQIPPPGGTPRLGPQPETGTPASGPSTDLTPPFQHTRSPRTGGCPRPELWGQWTRRVTVTASAPPRTQVGPTCHLPSPGTSLGFMISCCLSGSVSNG